MPKSIQEIISGALYHFAGELTSRQGTMLVGSSHEVGPMADAVKRFCDENGIGEGEPDIKHWQDVLWASIDPDSINRIRSAESCPMAVEDAHRELVRAIVHEFMSKLKSSSVFCGGTDGIAASGSGSLNIKLIGNCDGDHGGPACPDPECWLR